MQTTINHKEHHIFHNPQAVQKAFYQHFGLISWRAIDDLSVIIRVKNDNAINNPAIAEYLEKLTATALLKNLADTLAIIEKTLPKKPKSATYLSCVLQGDEKENFVVDYISVDNDSY